jgi:hypothetical protein
MVCFEDIDRCAFFQKKYYEYGAKNRSIVRNFLNELDGIIENPKRITIITVNDKTVIENIHAMIRPGRINQPGLLYSKSNKWTL